MKRKYLFFQSVTGRKQPLRTRMAGSATRSPPRHPLVVAGKCCRCNQSDLQSGRICQSRTGSVEITPIYGVQGNDKNNLPFLSPQWMNMLQHTEAEGKTYRY